MRESRLKSAPLVQLAVAGALVPEALAAAELLEREGVAVNVLNLTSARRLFEHWQAARKTAVAPLDWLIRPEERQAPIVTAVDAAAHNLAWLGSVYGAPLHALGVDALANPARATISTVTSASTPRASPRRHLRRSTRRWGGSGAESEFRIQKSIECRAPIPTSPSSARGTLQTQARSGEGHPLVHTSTLHQICSPLERASLSLARLGSLTH
ncbi:hypothetical protein HC891_17380 [Candidatus Gracilibacteria bacterium]|nr:hypothetical protein [Candidatus Gracilibacteria bacterium]